MNTITNIISFLEGKKTYIIAGLTIILGLLQSNSSMVMSGFGLIGIRGAVSNIPTANS